MNSNPLHHQRPTPLPEFLYGSAYYPEHWDEATRQTDPALFKAANWNVIRMGEFAWDRLEPNEGVYDFSLFDETIDRFGAVGIRTILCTPTATPPRWLTLRYPEVLRMDAAGIVQQHGSRQHASHFSEVYRSHSRRITQALANHYAGHPHVIGWQTDNEFHCHFCEDHSPATQLAWVEFLRTRFHNDINELNCAWGTAFWSQTYGSFDQVPTPRPGQPTHPNPAHSLDYYRFLSHGVTLFQRDQIDILRAANPAWWVTHNGCFGHIDYAGDFTRDLDFLSYDSYPLFEPDWNKRPANQAFNTDYVRAYSGNFVVMEQQCGPGGQNQYLLDTPEPGEMRKWAYVNIARGADGALLFRERTCRFGAEEYWIGVLDHDNVPRRRYCEAAQLGSELKRFGPSILGTSVTIQIAVVGAHSETQSAHQPLTLGLPSPRNVAETVHNGFFQGGYSVGCIHPNDNLAGISVMFLPHFAMIDPEWLAPWQAWVEAGGVLVIGARSGSKDMNNNVVAATLPGALRHLVGATVEEYGHQNRPDLRPLSLRFKDEENTVLTETWYEQLIPDAGTESVAHWESRHLAGTPAITRRSHGLGWVYYVGTYFTATVIAELADHLTTKKLLPSPRCGVPSVEFSERTCAAHTLHFYINHNDHTVRIPLKCAGHELITELPVTDSISLEPNAVAIVQH